MVSLYTTIQRSNDIKVSTIFEGLKPVVYINYADPEYVLKCKTQYLLEACGEWDSKSADFKADLQLDFLNSVQNKSKESLMEIPIP